MKVLCGWNPDMDASQRMNVPIRDRLLCQGADLT